ncbi:hypothetical protein, partial [Bacteroides caecimuris]|uniref:hypothetical protein n=1 Tax=Bacteroides caecimuris TaxID=1796613 RepID=UPI0026E91C7A
NIKYTTLSLTMIIKQPLITGEKSARTVDRCSVSAAAHAFHCGLWGVRITGNRSHNSCNVMSARAFCMGGGNRECDVRAGQPGNRLQNPCLLNW